MNRSIYFEINSRMRKLFERYNVDYKVNPDSEIPEKLYKYIRRGVVKRNDNIAFGCWTYKYNRHFALDFPKEDYAGNEVANSEIFISAENENISIAQTIKLALSYSYALAEVLIKKNVDFDIVLSYQSSMSGDELPLNAFDVRFYQKRNNQSYLIDNLEIYNKYNGILVISIQKDHISSNIYPDKFIRYTNDMIMNGRDKMGEYTKLIELLCKFSNLGVFNNKQECATLIGQVKSIAANAWLNVLYNPVKTNDIERVENRLKRAIPDCYKEFLTRVSNGLNILCDTLCLYGIRGYANSHRDREPYDIEIPNLFERPNNSTDKMFFIGWYDWDNSQLYINEDNKVCYCSKNDARPLKIWNSIESMLIDEIKRLYTLVDDNGVFLDYGKKSTPV